MKRDYEKALHCVGKRCFALHYELFEQAHQGKIDRETLELKMREVGGAKTKSAMRKKAEAGLRLFAENRQKDALRCIACTKLVDKDAANSARARLASL